jgi:two-component system, NtrC family, nitrogen regulation response regulator GlnG
LTQHFLKQSAKQLGVDPKRISTAALQTLSHFSFPGNVRQLENICHWLSVMAPAAVIDHKDLPPEVLEQASTTANANSVSTVPTTSAANAESSPSKPESQTGEMSMPHLNAVAQALPAEHWEQGVYAQAQQMLQAKQTDIWDALNQRFEAQIIQAALSHCRGRRVEAAQMLGMGRNTIARKIQELGLQNADE